MAGVAAVVLYVPTGGEAPAYVRVTDRRCRGGCTDSVLFRVLPGGPTSSQIAAGTLATSTGAAITTVRASNKYCGNASGGLTLLSSNQPCVDTIGLNSEPSATNLLLQSEDFTSASWTKTNVTVTANSGTGPWGAATADTLQSTVAGGLAQSADVTAAASSYSASGWCWTGAGTQSFDVVIFDVTGAAALKTCAGLSATTSTNTGATRWACENSTVPTAGHIIVARLYPGTSAGTGTVICGGLQMEAGKVATSYIPTAGTTATRAADIMSVSWPARSGSDFSIRMRAVSNVAFSSSTVPFATHFQLYSTTGGHERLRVSHGGPWTLTQFATGASQLDTFTGVTESFAAGTTRIICETWTNSTSAATMTIKDASGTTVASASNSQSGGITDATTFYLGVDHLNGDVRQPIASMYDVCVSASTTGCPCQ
jgi:hypothetical protein